MDYGASFGVVMAKIVVVDDDPTFRQAVCHAVRSEGHEPISLATAREALTHARHSKPDLFLIDLMLPGVNGLQLLLALKSDPVTAVVPVIAWTANTADDVTRQAQAFEADAVLHKTKFSMLELRRLIREQLAKSAPVGHEPLPRRVLAVEDDENTRVAVEKHLLAAGYAVSQASNGWEALLALDRESIELVLLDLVMPGMDGQTFLRILRESDRHRSTPVIVVTAFDVPEMLNLINPLGVSKVLGKKTLLWDQLVPAVHDAMAAA